MRNDYRKNASDLPARTIVLVRHKIKRPGYSIAPQFHPGHELIYVDYGRISLSVNGQNFAMETGDCFIIPASVRHNFSGEQGRPFDFLNIVFRGTADESIACKVIQLLTPERRIMHTLKEESANRQEHTKSLMLLKLNELLLLLRRRQSQPAVPAEIKGDNRLRYQDMIVNKALRYLYEHMARPLDDEMAARHAGVSASHLRLLVRRETGMTLRRHLRKMRIDFAMHLLKESAENIDAIAYRTGYRSAPHFCSVFKRQVRMTPSEYAKSL
jgi:AraC-like DNA-binding protein/mannose-6-phosphate isomerase-like protein (cupin superfamily)